MTILALDLLQSGVPLSMLCAVVGLLFAFSLDRQDSECAAR